MDNNKNNTTVKCGLGFCEVLTLILIVLKLLGKISLSWLWVLAPLWISWGLAIIVILIIFIIAMIIS